MHKTNNNHLKSIKSFLPNNNKQPNNNNNKQPNNNNKQPNNNNNKQPNNNQSIINKKKYGWDHKNEKQLSEIEHPFKVLQIHHNLHNIKEISLIPKFPPVYDQGDLGSCTSNSIIAGYEYTMNKQNEKYEHLSRLGLYWMERFAENPENITEDLGAQISTGVNLIHTKGVGLESLWPYDVTKFAEKPPVTFFNDLKYHTAIKVQRINKTIQAIDQCLLDGNPVIFGFTVYDSFESQEVATTGYVPIPNPNKEQCLGGHAVIINKCFVKNSKEYYEYIVEEHNNTIIRSWSPAITFDKDILYFASKLNYFDHFNQK
jgi:hypothetical protein